MILASTGLCVAEMSYLLMFVISVYRIFDEIPALVISAIHASLQIFKSEVPKRRIYHGKPDTTQVGQHRLDLKYFSLWN